MATPKFTDEEKTLIRKLNKENKVSYARLAEEFGCSERTIIRICRPEVAASDAAKTKEYRARNAKREAENQKNNYRTYILRYHNENDKTVIERLNGQKSIQHYIRQLILKDIEKNPSHSDSKSEQDPTK